MSPVDARELVLVTGASSGIGRALAHRLAQDHADLALMGRDKIRLQEAVRQCRESGAKAEGFALDLAANLTGIATMVREVEARFGRPVDTLIHAAGRACVGRIEDVPLQEIRDCISVNLTAAFALCAAVLPAMKQRRSGRLVFFTSGTAYHGVPTESAYSASKAGLERLAESLRLECQPFGVSVTLVSPGPVETPLLRRPLVYGSATPMGRPRRAADPNAVASAIVHRLRHARPRIELSLRPRLVRWISGVAPSLLSLMLRLEMKRAAAAGRPCTGGG